MANNTTSEGINQTELPIVIYYPLFLVIIGTILNLLTFVVFCRSIFRNVKKHPAMHYMRAMAIFDILMLYGWNLDHYLSPAHGFTMLNYSIVSCKFFSFLNYVAAQTSAWFRVFLCLERYLSLSRRHRTCFSQPKIISIIIACIVGIFSVLNSPLLIAACYYKPNGKISYGSQLFLIYPLWDYINLGVYNCVPFISMVILNSGVIYHLKNYRRTSMVQNSRIQHRSISITLLITTFLFSIMTIPVTVAYAFFSNTATSTILHTLDSILYTYHITSFPLYMITFGDFRREFIAMITYSRKNHRVSPSPAIISKMIPLQRMLAVKNIDQLSNQIQIT